MEALISEVSDLSRRNDELMLSKDSDLIVIRDLDAQLKEYKRKYEQAKTELRSMKGLCPHGHTFAILSHNRTAATSALFLQKPKFDDQLPVSADGAIPDVHLTAFLTAIDSLLSAGRSNAPTRVLTPMKSVVNAVTTILDDVRSHSRRNSDPEGVRALEERVEATLSNLVAATKTHATSSGLSPVSLLDAAASHVSAAITELGRVVLLRRATKSEQDHFAPSSSSTGTGTHATNGFVPALRTVEEGRSSATHQRGLSESSSRRSDREREREREPVRDEREQPAHSESSSDDSSAAPTIFDQSATNGTTIARPDSATGEGSEDAWTELRVRSLVFYASCVACSRRRTCVCVCVCVISSHT
jgi:protein SPA2